jgi:hypothetical protein
MQGFGCLAVVVLIGVVALAVSHAQRREWWRLGMWLLLPVCGFLTFLLGVDSSPLAFVASVWIVGLATAGVVIEVKTAQQIKAESEGVERPPAT